MKLKLKCLIVALTGLLALFGCNRATFKGSGDPRKDLREAYQKTKTAFPYRITEIDNFTSGATKQETKRVAEYAAPDRVHIKINDIEFIQIEDKTYWKQRGKWIQADKARKPAAAQIERFFSEGVKDVQSAGTETVNGVPCAVYTVRIEFNWDARPATGTGKVWIGLSDGLVHQSDGDFTIASYTTKSHIVYEYNVDFKVEAPSL